MNYKSSNLCYKNMSFAAFALCMGVLFQHRTLVIGNMVSVPVASGATCVNHDQFTLEVVRPAGGKKTLISLGGQCPKRLSPRMDVLAVMNVVRNVVATAMVCRRDVTVHVECMRSFVSSHFDIASHRCGVVVF